jgi:hypothetical protein
MPAYYIYLLPPTDGYPHVNLVWHKMTIEKHLRLSKIEDGRRQHVRPIWRRTQPPGHITGIPIWFRYLGNMRNAEGAIRLEKTWCCCSTLHIEHLKPRGRIQGHFLFLYCMHPFLVLFLYAVSSKKLQARRDLLENM